MTTKRRGRRLEKRVDQTHYLTGRKRGGILKEEVWYESDEVVKYSLAFIDPQICGVDNGRVLGYDNAHGTHHRHFMGTESQHTFTAYDELLSLFEEEVEAIWRKHGNDA